MMLDGEDGEELVFPGTLQETKAAIAALIGDITEARTWLKLQYEGKAAGLWVDYNAIREKNLEIAALQGDIDALKKHAASLRDIAQSAASEAALEKLRLKAANLAKQKEIERQAQEAKRDRKLAAAEHQARRETAAMTAVDQYIKANLPDHLATIRAIVTAARNATK